MSAAAKKEKATWPTKAKVKFAVDVARELGLDVIGFEISGNGTVRVFDSRAVPQTGKEQNSFDRFQDQL